MDEISFDSKILIVDDDPILAELLATYLEEYSTIIVSNGQEALEEIKSNDIDAVLLDVMMPDLNGFDVCMQIKDEISTGYIPVLMVTALTNQEDKIKGFNSGADDFITKPVDEEELKARVRSSLKIKHLHDQLKKNHDELYRQHQVRKVLTGIIPTLLKQTPKEKKKILIHQMVDELNSLFNEMYASKLCSDTKNTDNENLDDIKKACTDFANYLGGHFIVNNTDNNRNDVLFALKGTSCPWGTSQAKLNPILCNLTKKIFHDIISEKYCNISVDTIKTMGNGDDCCYFEILKYNKTQ
jgi:DNA-binding response OmpR family regulator